MTQWRQQAAAVALVLLAATLQGRTAHSIAVLGVQPDFVLIALSCGAALCGGSSGIGLGFWAGLLTAAMAAVNPGSFLSSRTLAGALAGWLQGSVIQNSLAVPPLVALVTTLAAELIYVFMVPTHHLRTWAVGVGGEIVYNMALAIPVYAVLRRLGLGQSLEDPFGQRL